MIKSVNNSLFFYQDSRLVTVKQGKHHRAIFRSAEMPLAEQQAGGTRGNGLLATDDKGSVLHVSGDDEKEQHAYTSYGHTPTLPSFLTLLGFNGERYDEVIKSALLGNGYRSYSPGLMRFQSPDDWSPFGQGGINAYCYCQADPVNAVDPSGHIWRLPFGVNTDSATPGGGGLNRSTLKRATSLPILGAGSPPSPPRRNSLPDSLITAPTKAIQQVTPRRANTPLTPAQGVSRTARAEPPQLTPNAASSPTNSPTPVNRPAPNGRPTNGSRDSTPPSSRPATPTSELGVEQWPYHVQTTVAFRNSEHYSRKYYPSY